MKLSNFYAYNTNLNIIMLNMLERIRESCDGDYFNLVDYLWSVLDDLLGIDEAHCQE